MQENQPQKVIQQNFTASYNYPVHFTQDIFSQENSLLKDLIAPNIGNLPKKVLYIIDEQVVKHYSKLPDSIKSYHQTYRKSLVLVCPPMSIPGGEPAKNNPQYVEQIYKAVNDFGIDRHSFIIAIGGGALLDMVGFAAATAHRGIRHIRIPTTVLAQNDSAVGVKNGINMFGKKNFVGSFAPPFAVINDSSFLTKLPDRDWRSGIAEAIKVALLKDAVFFAFIESTAQALAQRDIKTMEHLIYRCAQLHLQHIATSGDPFEFGSSRPLDFGHWAGHKLEQLTQFELRHGEAVAIGIAIDTTYSHLMGYLPKKDWERVLHVLKELQLPTYHSIMDTHLNDNAHKQSVLHGLEEFREHLGGILTIILLQSIGTPIQVNTIDYPTMKKAIKLLNFLNKKI